MTVSAGRLAQWRLKLFEYDFNVIYRAGVKHQAVDALSRIPMTVKDHNDLDDDLSILSSEVPNSNSFDAIKQNAFHVAYILNEATFNRSDTALPSRKGVIVEQATDS